MANKRNPGSEPLITFDISVIITVVAVIVGVVFAYLGFSKAGDSRVTPSLVSLFLLISGAGLITQFVNGIRRKEQWQRVLAVISILAAIFIIVMAYVLYQALQVIQMPTF